MAAHANKWHVSDFQIRFEAAWDAITDYLLAADEPPHPGYLGQVGKVAISHSLLKDFCHTYGVAERDLTAGIASGHRFAKYWTQIHEPAEDRFTDLMALAQVRAALDPRHTELLDVLAVCGTNEAAARKLGMPKSTFSVYVGQARDAFEALWFDWETPPQRRRAQGKYSPSEWNTSREAECGTPGAYRRHKRRHEPVDDACEIAGREHEAARKRAARTGAKGKAA
jgi:hypothetical protein